MTIISGFCGWNILYAKMKRMPAVLLLCMTVVFAAGCGATGDGGAPTEVRGIANEEMIIKELREGMKAHSQGIHIRFSYSAAWENSAADLTAAWMERALDETDDPSEGDYLRYQTGGYQVSRRRVDVDGDDLLELIIRPRYYCYLSQDVQAEERLCRVMESFAFDKTATDTEKLRAIYDWLCAHVSYDAAHQDNPYQTLRSTMYSALVRGSATCQGYAVTLYRMAREAGVDCRVITGTGIQKVQTAHGETAEREEYHAWNIAQIGGVWYAMDATWDAGAEKTRYFLRGSEDFEGHFPDGKFIAPDFIQSYPMAQTSVFDF